MMNATSDLESLVKALYLECLRGGGGVAVRVVESGGGGASESKVDSNNQSVKDASLLCPLTFDGYLCWPPTPAGHRIAQPCPSFVTGFDSSRDAFKT